MRDLSKILSVSVVLGTLAVFGFSPGPKVDLVQPVGIFEAAKLDTPTEHTAHGSGVFISPTRFLTAGHVLKLFSDKTTAHIRMEDGNIYNVIAVHPADGVDAGYAEIDPNHPYKGYIPKISCEAEPIGTELINVGSPLGLEFIESKITVTGGRPRVVAEQNSGLTPPPAEDPSGPNDRFQRHQPPDDKQQQEEPANINGTVFFQGIALPGQSGSPIYNRDGEVIGVLVVTIVDPQTNSYTGLGLYVATNSFCKFAQDAENVA